MVRFSLFGIPVNIQPFFWLTMAFLSGNFSVDSTQGLINMMLFIIAGTFSILVHEFGHALTIRAYGLPTTVTLEAFGGFASYPAGVLNRKQSFLVTAAGPASQLLLALLIYLLLMNLPQQSMNANGLYFLERLIFISVLWALLNLLPIMPLDGGQLLNAILGPQRIKITLWVTIITAVVMGVTAYKLFNLGAIFLLIFFAYFAFQAYKELQENKWR
jgi:Zn-dependent protease